MINKIDKNKIIFNNKNIVNILLMDRNSKKNIIWATSDYFKNGQGYGEFDHIYFDLIYKNGESLIKTRVEKTIDEKNKRSKNSAEVFTPSWMCNYQNNLIDDVWFGYKNSFNIPTETNKWIPTKKVLFNNKSWIEYVKDLRLEITCGEAPYIVSMYDAVSGIEIPLIERIGLLDRKFRVINENAQNNDEWIKYSIEAIKSIYGYDFQGDNLFITRSNILNTYVDYYKNRFNSNPNEDLLLEIAYIISWNFWQMDGLKLVIPYSCNENLNHIINTPDKKNESLKCMACDNNKIMGHNGIKCTIMDWTNNKIIAFSELLNEYND